MKRAIFVAFVVACGPPKPSTTVPAPAVTTPEAPPVAVAMPDGLVPPQPTLRLPRNFVPSKYELRIAVDPKQDKFSGFAEITGAVVEKSSVIWLHGYHLAVTKAWARGASTVPLEVAAKGEDLLEVRATKALDAGEWTLAFEYTGEIDPVNTTGMFKQTVNGDIYVYTQLEAFYARRVLPCFDEPNVKTPWKLAFDVPKANTVVTNTPQTAEAALDANTKRVEFAVTKPLPTYLVAFGIGPFDIVDAGKTKRGVPVRIVTLAKRAAEAWYAAKITAKLVDASEEYFGIPYPYEKLDILTIPVTSGFAAMENAGLITFAERWILMEPNASKGHQWVYTISAAHEVSHQWFGDLVTPSFWDDIWLNEGFATWLMSTIAFAVDPSFRDSENAIDERDDALASDSLVTARRVRQPIASIDDVQNAFDGISYKKGAAVLYMFENYVGKAVFQKGVHDYMTARSWGNATSADFVAAITKASGTPQIEAAFASFLDQAGAPEITAATSCARGKVEVMLSQRRFVPPGAPEPAAGTPWIVPMCIVYEKAGQRAEACTLFDKVASTVALDTKTCPRWVMANATGKGYYRSAYTVQQITALRDEAWPKLTWSERRALHFDIVSATRTGKLPLQIALSFTGKMLLGNDRFTVPRAIALPTRFNTWIPDDLEQKYEFWLRQQFSAAATKAGFIPKPDESYDVEDTRRELIDAATWLGRDPALVAEAVRLAEKWRELPESMRLTVLSIAADAKPEVFDRLVKEVTSEPDRAKRGEMYAAIGAVRDPARRKTALALLLDPKVDVREHEIAFQNETPAILEITKQFLRDHKDALAARIPNAGTTTSLAQYAEIFTATCRADQRDAIADYVTKTYGPMVGGERTVKQAIEAMDQCIARRKIIEPELRAWLGGLRLPKPPIAAKP